MFKKLYSLCFNQRLFIRKKQPLLNFEEENLNRTEIMSSMLWKDWSSRKIEYSTEQKKNQNKNRRKKKLSKKLEKLC